MLVLLSNIINTSHANSKRLTSLELHISSKKLSKNLKKTKKLC